MELRATVRASTDLLNRHEDDHQVQALTPIIHQYAAMAANSNNPRAAFCMADLCHGLTDLSTKLADLCNESLAGKMGKAAAEGALRSAHDYITYAFYNPESFAIDLALGAFFKPAIVFRRLAILAYDAYQNRRELYSAAQQFITDIQQERYRDDEWLENNVSNFTQFFCDLFVTPRVGRRISRCSPVAPLARGFARQKAVVQACAQRGLNAATQKVSSSIKTLLQEASDAFKTRTLEPAFAGIERVEKAAEHVAPQQLRRSERLMKKAEGLKENSTNDVHPSTPVGRRGNRPETRIQKGLRQEAIIRGRKYCHHAIERMQERGYTPSIIEEAIRIGERSSDPLPGRIRFYDKSNNVGVIIEELTGTIVTIRDGEF